jgi:putative membrane-bound dehydrogenase-like protein
VITLFLHRARGRSRRVVPLVWFARFAALLGSAVGEGTPPQAVLPGVRFTLLAEQPAVVTPTGVDVDDGGRIWVVACHTHMPPPDYAGPKFDEVLVFSADGQRRAVFSEQTVHTMDLELGPDGWVYLAERGRVLRLRDGDGDGRADQSQDLAILATDGDYPHNALSGLAWHPDGSLWFGLGENFAKPWTLTGKDGRSFRGTGEGGVFRMAPDGTGLHRVARGMWNPFGLCVREDGEVFATDNDPGESPPCRLLHIVEGGDYGYNRRYGADASHPFSGWNGERRGTLPMVHPTGEAPCGVVALGSGLIVPSWSDHRIDFLPLTRKGASFGAKRFALVQGDAFFRPTGIAAVPGRNAWVVADWVDGRYPVHGFGRLWKLEVDLQVAASWLGSLALEPPTEAAKLSAALRSGQGAAGIGQDELFRLATDPDPFVARAALQALSREAAPWTPEIVRAWAPGNRLRAILALQLCSGLGDAEGWMRFFLADADPAVSFEALRWIGDASATALLAEVESFLGQPGLDFERFEAALAARNVLLGKPEAGVRDPDLLLAKVLDASSPARIRAMALRLLPSAPLKSAADGRPPARNFPKGLTLDLLDQLLATGDPDLSLEGVRTLGDQPILAASRLAAVASDPERLPLLRAEAVVALQAVSGEHRPLLVALAQDSEAVVREEALRALRGLALDPGEISILRQVAASHPEAADAVRAVLEPGFLATGRPAPGEVDDWIKRIAAVPGPADPEAGRRIFHASRFALCAQCHRNDGRGQVVGPDLSQGRDRRLLLQSILDPSAAIAPEYLPRRLDLRDGTSFTGIRLRSSTQEVMRDVYGQNRSFALDQIVGVTELDSSFMPPGLVFGLTDRELRDLLAYLEQ